MIVLLIYNEVNGVNLFLHSRATILVKIQREDSLLQFEPGDHIGIYPQNNSALVQGWLQL